MAHFFTRLNPNVVFVTIIALIVIGAYIGRQEYLDAKRTLIEAQCARQSLVILGGLDGSGYDANDIIGFGTITSLCVQSGGIEQYQEWIKLGADEKAKSAKPPSNNE